jgi:hypothetical protein
MSTPTRPIASIKIGQHRNIPALAKNIAEIGLIHPVVITLGMAHVMITSTVSFTGILSQQADIEELLKEFKPRETAE